MKHVILTYFSSFFRISFGFLLDLYRISEGIPKEIQKEYKANMIRSMHFVSQLNIKNILRTLRLHSVKML